MVNLQYYVHNSKKNKLNDWINYFNNLSLFVMFTNQLNQSTNKPILRMDLLHTKSIHTPYTVSGILERYGNRKSPNTMCIKAFKSGADETRTRDLLRDRQAF